MTEGILIGQYAGKVLKGNGAKKDNANMLWRRWALMFNKDDPFATRPLTVGWFQNGQINAQGVEEWDSLLKLEEGQFYTVKYYENPFTNSTGKPCKAKNYAGHLDGKQPELLAAFKAEQGQPAAAPTGKKVAIDWVKFTQEYDLAVPVGTPDRSARSMFGLYVLNKHGDEFSDIIQLVKKHFTQ